jgi:acid stress-induced BolA-like protein IbaG/YrbA
MNADVVKKLIEEKIAGCHAQVFTQDNKHFEAIVSSEQFSGLSRLQQQQMVYAALNHLISTGELHALSLKTIIPSEK